MKYIDKTDLLIDKIYYADWGDKSHVILKYSGNLLKCEHIYNNPNYKFANDSCCTSNNINFRYATEEEISIFYKIQNKNVKKKNKINLIYEIY